MTSMQKWLRIGATLMFGLFVAYLDRSNLSVTLPTITHDLNIDGATASIVLTIFLIGYAFSNIFGGVFTQRYDPKKIVILMVLIWSIATVFVGFTSSVYVILICRLVLGITEGIYWPQQSRFASDWFSDKERTQANSIIQYYGQFLALGLGFMILSPLDAAFGWRNVFIITGVIGIVVVVPLYITMLKNRKKRLIIVRRRQQRKLNLPWNRWAEPLPTPYFYLHHSRDVVLGNYVMDTHGCQFSRLYRIQ